MQNDPAPSNENRSGFNWFWIGCVVLVIGAVVVGFAIKRHADERAAQNAPAGEPSLQAAIKSGFRGHYDHVTFSPDGKVFAATKSPDIEPSGSQEIKMWDVSSGVGIELRWPENEMARVNVLTFTPDGSHLAATGYSSRNEAPKNGAAVEGAMAPKGPDTAKATVREDWSRSVLFHVASRRCSCWLTESVPPALSMVPLADSQTFAFGGESTPIQLKRFVRKNPDPKTAVAFPDTWGKVGVIPGHSGDKVTVRALALTRDGKMLASASSDTTIKLWGVETRQEIRTLKGHDDAVTCVKFSPDGLVLASGAQKGLKGDQRPGEVRLWDVSTGTTKFALNHEFGIRVLAFSADGKMLVTGSSEHLEDSADPLRGELRFWDVETGKEIASAPWAKPVHSLAFYPDGRTLVVATSGGLELVDVPEAGRERE